MAEFVMPQLGADMSAGKLLSWRKQVGDFVKRGDIIADVETDKADIEIETFTTGIIERLVCQPGEKVPVGTVLAIIRTEGEPELPPSQALRETAAASVPMPAAPSPAAPGPARTQAVPVAPVGGRMRISPAARKAAEELGVDLASVTGTGPAGRITIEDVQQAARTIPEIRERTTVSDERYVRMRQAIATAMARSKREIPHYYLGTTIDMTSSLDWLSQENQKRSVEDRLLYGILLIKAVARALGDVPELNSSWIDGREVKNSRINVGVAISLRRGGLIAPALLDADQRSLGELMKNFGDLVKRARIGSLRSSELSESTITVTSLGEQGVESVYGVIYPPQVALVGFGKIVEQPRCVNGHVAPRRILWATLSADHRVSDGHRGGLFLAAVDRLLQQPECL
jgi:pyruvate dehydrogenase E2 component (dihydrolipoamide acetyltransferase)